MSNGDNQNNDDDDVIYQENSSGEVDNVLNKQMMRQCRSNCNKKSSSKKPKLEVGSETSALAAADLFPSRRSKRISDNQSNDNDVIYEVSSEVVDNVNVD